MQFRILGPLEVEHDGAPLKLAGAKQRSLLALLLLSPNEVVSRDALIDGLWGEHPPSGAGHSLEAQVSRLRKLLRNGQDLVSTHPGGYALRVEDGELDRQLFERLADDGRSALRAGDERRAAELLREAVSLWRGAALEGIDVEATVLAELRGLEERRLTAYEDLMAAELARGNHVGVLPELERLVALSPLRERFLEQLMLALYRAGRQADALASYRNARRILAAELGLEPGDDLRRLEQAILRQDESLRLARQGVAGNVPRPATSLIGRQREIGDVLRLLDIGARLINLTGPGGSGKTRLALEVAHRATTAFPEGTFFAALAPLRDHGLVRNTIRQCLGASGDIAQHIGKRRLLLLVDNFEHVIDSAGEVASLVQACPNLFVLSTSRELLRVHGETEYEVPPLDDSDAVALFCARAHTDPDPYVADLCRRLDNLALAIELAAARSPVLSPRQILSRLAQRLDLLEARSSAEARQHTLRATLEWSYDLLSSDEQQLFARLAVFAGGCSLEAAEAVAGADLDTLQALVEKSLVRHARERFRMLAITREFAIERLQASGEADEIRARHAAYFAALAESASSEFWSDGASWNAMIMGELDNLRASLSYAGRTGDSLLLLRLAGAPGGSLWTESDLIEESQQWLEDALANGDNALEARIQALRGLITVAGRSNDEEAVCRYATQLLALARETDDRDAMFSALLSLGVNSNPYADDSEAMFAEAARVAEETENRVGLAFVALNRGSGALRGGRYEEALVRSDEAAALWNEIGHPVGEAASLTNSGSAARNLNCLDDASDRFRRALELTPEIGVVVLPAMGGLAAIELARGRLVYAARLTGLVASLCERGEALEHYERGVHLETTSALAEELDKETLTAALNYGRSKSLEEAVRYALECTALDAPQRV